MNYDTQPASIREDKIFKIRAQIRQKKLENYKRQVRQTFAENFNQTQHSSTMDIERPFSNNKQQNKLRSNKQRQHLRFSQVERYLNAYTKGFGTLQQLEKVVNITQLIATYKESKKKATQIKVINMIINLPKAYLQNVSTSQILVIYYYFLGDFSIQYFSILVQFIEKLMTDFPLQSKTYIAIQRGILLVGQLLQKQMVIGYFNVMESIELYAVYFSYFNNLFEQKQASTRFFQEINLGICSITSEFLRKCIHDIFIQLRKQQQHTAEILKYYLPLFILLIELLASVNRIPQTTLTIQTINQIINYNTKTLKNEPQNQLRHRILLFEELELFFKCQLMILQPQHLKILKDALKSYKEAFESTKNKQKQ